MYKDFTGNSITLKLFTGTSWAWVRCRFRGRSIPEGAERLSPLVVIRKNRAYLHIPVKEPVEDIRPVKERVGAAGEPLCAVTFTNTDAFAVCSVLSADGRMTASRFVRGGKEYMHHSKRLLGQIKQNRSVMGKRFDWTGCNKRYWERLYNLSNYWAHKISREIVDFCVKHGATTIALPEADYEGMKRIAGRTGKYSPIYLSLRIRRYLTYKARKEGIAITYVRPAYTASVCCRCGAWLEKGRQVLPPKAEMELVRNPKAGAAGEASERVRRSFLCPNGHRGNQDLNTARNIGRNCLNKLGRRPA